MSYPTTQQLVGWVDTINAIMRQPLAARLDRAIELDRRGGTAIPDGYPPSTLGGGGISELTSVEAAVVARQHARDEHHDRTRYAVSYLEQAILSLSALVTQLDRIENLAHHPIGREAGCANHARYDIWASRYRGDLCQLCYRFEKDHGRVPPASLIDDKARGIKWTTASVQRALSV